MHLPHYRPRRSLTVLAALLTTSIAVLCLTQTAPAQVKKTPKTPEVIDNKRPLTHKDYDIWNTIQTPLISPDGKIVAYTLASPEGDSELVVRNVDSGKEFRHSRGRIGAKGGAGAGAENKVQFSEDSARVVFTIFPPKSEAGKKADKDAPRPSLGIIEVANGKVKVIPNVRTFQLPENDPDGLLYHKLPPVMAATPKGADSGDDDDDVDDLDFLQTKGKGQGKKGGDAKQPAAAQAAPSDLVIHNMKEGAEAVFADVSAFTMTRDGATLVCVMAGKDADSTGLFAFTPGPDGRPAKKHLVPGKAKFSRFTWDEKQQVLAFFVDNSTSPKEPGKLSIYLWGRPIIDKKGKITEDFGAIEILNSGNTTGLKEGCVLTERGGLSFSEDGTKLFVGVAPPPQSIDIEAVKGAAKDDKAVVELWHWKDDFIQPMQKARGNQDKMRTYTAVFTGKGNKLVQLADSKMPSVTVSRDGNSALGSDDTPYRQLVAYDATYNDIYLVKTSDGSRKPLLKKHHWGISFSPSGKYAIFYDGKDWNTIGMPGGGKPINITATITKDPKNKDVKFYNEDHDSPSPSPAYGICGWSKDDSLVYIYDKYDIWEFSPTGSSHRNLTSSLGRKEGIQFRYAKVDPKEKGIDTRKPMLLRAEVFQTRESGFFALNPQAANPPTILALGPAALGVPVKAKNADRLLLTSQSFYEFPDLYVSSLDFKLTNKVSDANPHKKDFNWGKSLLVHYKNADGVPLSGILIVPENFSPDKKYPMIVYIYEKLSQNVHHFVVPKEGTSINATYYASNGYLVFMPDIVYNVGYPGQSALKCVLPGIQAVIDRGIVDENAIGIQGHSWGGYQIAYMVTQTNRFKAAAAGAPVSNMTSAYDGIRWGTGMPRQFQYEKTQSRIGGTLWEFPMRFVENSPVFMADRVKTPLMMLHNDQDDAVPWYQGIEYYLALRRLGKEVYMFNYPGEKHGLQKKANKIDYTIRMQQFFDHHLRGQPAPEWMMKGIPYAPRPALKADPAAGGGGD